MSTCLLCSTTSHQHKQMRSCLLFGRSNCRQAVPLLTRVRQQRTCEDLSGFSVVRRGRLNVFAPPHLSSPLNPSLWSPPFCPSSDVPEGMRWVNSAMPGDVIGDTALLVPAQAESTIKAAEPTSLWCLDRCAYRTILACINAKESEDLDSFVRQLPGIADLTSSALVHLVCALESQTLPPFTRMCDDIPANRMYMVKEGSVSVIKHIGPTAVSTAATSLSSSSRPSLDTKAVADEENVVVRLRAPSGEPLDSVEVVCTYSKGEWFAKKMAAGAGQIVEGRQSGVGTSASPESSCCGLATLCDGCELLSTDVEAFERTAGPLEQFIANTQLVVAKTNFS
eukprot:GHVS01093977.1.p1 GENE.GHVS01093977.1~~GHVS01093977.1.p1  ORF type:complete len:338 (+),score=53.14 GHVS01093977.1:373-1386(+)